MDSIIETPKVDGEETPQEGGTPTESASECQDCKKTARETAQNEEIALAFLLALVPVISLTFFGNLGLL